MDPWCFSSSSATVSGREYLDMMWLYIGTSSLSGVSV
jgi:hypothetical protein